MTDFETHPAGTADLVKHLRGGLVMVSVGLRAADRIEELETALAAVGNASAHRITDLETALTRANAATAAAYEVAAKAAHEEAWPEDGTYGPEEREIEDAERATVTVITAAIRALATPDQTAALDKLIAEAVKPYAEALRVLISHTHECERELTEALYHADFCGESGPLTDARAILAASKKGGV